MARGDFPSAKQDQFMVRFPDGLRDRIAERAKEEGRSMNAEIVATLEAAYPPPIPLEEIFDSMVKFFRHSKRPADIKIYQENMQWLADRLQSEIVHLKNSNEGAKTQIALLRRLNDVLEEDAKERSLQLEIERHSNMVEPDHASVDVFNPNRKINLND